MCVCVLSVLRVFLSVPRAAVAATLTSAFAHRRAQDKGHVVQFEMSAEQVQSVVSELDKIDATLEAAQA